MVSSKSKNNLPAKLLSTYYGLYYLQYNNNKQMVKVYLMEYCIVYIYFKNQTSIQILYGNK